jgi:hypothetical protein
MVAAPEVTNVARPASEARSGAQAAENSRVADQNVEPSETIGNHPAEAVEGWIVHHVEGHQRRRLAALGADRVIDFLKPTDRARHQHDLGAFTGKTLRHGGADAPRGAGNDRDAAFKPGRHQSVSDNRENWRRSLPPSWSTSSMG